MAKLLLISHQLDLSGAPISLLKIFQEINRRSCHVCNVIAMRDGPLRNLFSKSGNRVYFIGSHNSNTFVLRTLGLFKLLYFFLRIGKIDCVLINSAVNLRAMTVSILLRKRVYVYLRESENMLSEGRLSSLRLYLLSRVTGIIAVSQSTRRWVSNYLPYSHVTVVPNGVDFSEVIPQRVHPGKRFRKYVVGIIGLLGERKGVDRFLSVMSTILSERNDITFFVIGDFQSEIDGASFAAVGRRYGYSAAVKTGMISHVYEYIKYLDVHLLLSREEALPRCVMEASACGVPTICLDVAGTSELLPRSYPYIVCSFDSDKIIRLVYKLIERSESSFYGALCRRHVRQKFDLRITVDKVLSLMLDK
jgi:glycosyltransferase involved in cell wall biosynthesis